MTDSVGRYALSGTFRDAVTLRATKEGYVTATQTLDVRTLCNSCPAFMTFELALPENVTIETGDYTLTFAADSACTDLPADVRIRAYAATIAPNMVPGVPANTQYLVTVPGTSSWCCGPGGFGIGVAGHQVAITDDTGDQILDQLGSFRYLEFSLGGDAVLETPATSTMSFGGQLDYCELKSSIGNAFCRFVSGDQLITRVICGGSRFTLTKR